MNAPQIPLVSLLASACVAAPAPFSRDDEHAAAHGTGTQSAAVFVGGSGEAGDLDGVTLGVEYGRRLGALWGLTVYAEAVTGLERSFATGVEAFVNPIGGLVLYAGPGIERYEEEWSVIGRVGAAYEFEFGEGLFVAPGVYYDVSEHTDLLIYGVSTGIAW